MFKKPIVFAGLVLCFLLLLFFNKFFFHLYIPFPGDLLVHDYAPWKYYSYLGYNPASYPTKNQYFDVIRQLYPWKTLVIDLLKTGQIPLWNPYNFAGSPLLANLQSQVFAPFNLLYFIFPFVYGWSFALMLQIVLAFIFTYLYSRRINFQTEGAVFAAVAFSCSLYMSVFFQYGVFGQTILWLPLILFGIEGLSTKISFKQLFISTLGLVFAAFGGHLQVFSYVFLFSLLYAIFRVVAIKEKNNKTIFFIAFSFLISLGIAAIQLLPSAELIQLSARTSFDVSYFLQHLLLKPNELILLLSPDFYGNPATNNFLLTKSYPQTALYVGVIPLIFAVSVIFLKKSTILKFYLATVIILLISISVNPTSFFFYSLHLPIISSSAPTNAIFLISFSLSILAGYGLDQWINKKNKFVFPVMLTLVGILLATILFHKVFHADFSSKNIVYSFAILIVFFILWFLSRFLQRQKIFAVVFILITIFDLFYFFQKFNPFVPQALVYPDAQIISVIKQKAGIDRVWGYGSANIAANTNTLFTFFSPEGYDPLYPRKYGSFIYASKNNKLLQSFDQTTRSDAVVTIPDATKMLNVLGVRYIVDRVENGSTEKTFPGNIFKSVYDQDGWKVYENTHAVPRSFLTSDYILYNSDQDFEKKFFSSTFDLSKTIFLTEKPSFANSEWQMANGKAEIVSYKPNKVEISVTTNRPALLFLSDMYYPGWKAYVDGKQRPILRADYTFRAVEVPQGEHSVTFVYQPQSFLYGAVVSFISFCILIIVGLLIFMRK